ncbi:permease [Sphaerisporangium fuscum]|uniref:permease n=1 Tax=Sphaerisporangium fuscum TaxID=2835868 RepID=UPI001BDC1345|nr:permease [Sphaerisporangium fuscum]
MITGHFGLAAAVKSGQRQVPLWALMLATVWLDVVFAPLYMAKIEYIVPVPGTKGGYGEGIIYADYTHSLLGALLIAAVTGALAAWRWNRRSGVVIGAVVFSHWILDLLVHRADLPLLPGNLGGLPRLGLGLWQYPWLTAAIEGALMLVGALLYWRAATGLKGGRTSAAVNTGLLVLIGAATLALDVAGI